QAQELAGVELHGYVTGAAKSALENQAGVVAVPSIVATDGDVDGLPVAAIEGLARGAYVVATDVSGAQELLQGTTAGTVVRAGDTAALAQAIIAAMQRDLETRARDSAAASHIAQGLEWPVLAHPMLRELQRTEGWHVQGSRP